MGYRRIVLRELGGPEFFEWVEEELLPEPGLGEVRLRVLAAGASFTDTLVRRGKYPDVKATPPFTPGYDMVGVVDALGEGAGRVRRGQRVADLTVLGAYAEYICLSEDCLVAVPNGLDPAEAVSLVLPYLTAHQLLHRVARVRAGDSILVHAAGGAVGTAILQLGGLLGLTMYATASRSKHALVERLGGTPIDYRTEDFVERVLAAVPGGVAAAFDPIGGGSYRRSFQVVRRGGTLAAFGFYNPWTGRGGNIPLEYIGLQVRNLLPNGKSAAFYSIGSWRKKHPDWFQEDLATLFRLLAQGKIRPVIAQRMPLAEAAQAHRLIERAAVQGRIVLMAGPE